MKRKILISIVLFFCITLHIYGQEKGGFHINGQFIGLPNKSKVYLVNQEGDTIDRTFSKDNNFVFKGKLLLDGRFHFIRFDTLVCNKITPAFFLINGAISISGVICQNKIAVVGSPDHLQYEKLSFETEKIEKRYIEQLQLTNRDSTYNAIRKKINIEKDTLKLKHLIQQKESFDQKPKIIILENVQMHKRWIVDNPGSLLAAKMISKFYKPLYSLEAQQAYNQLTSRAKTGYYGVELKSNIIGSKLGKDVKPYAVLPDFMASNIDQKSFSILDYVKKSKITLIDFWASWCGPCRAQIPNLRKVYNDFHDKGFNIIGISTDVKEADWKKAIAEDNTPWFHGRDNIANAAKSIFSIGAIPAFVLVDGEGKLIAYSCASSDIASFGPILRGEGLYKTVENLINQKK